MDPDQLLLKSIVKRIIMLVYRCIQHISDTNLKRTVIIFEVIIISIVKIIEKLEKNMFKI